MSNEVAYGLIAVTMLLAPLALQKETHSTFGWSVSYPRALLITSLIYLALALPLIGTDAQGWLQALEESPNVPSIAYLALFGAAVTIWLVCALLIIKFLLRSPSGYSIRFRQALRLTGATTFSLSLLAFTLILSLSLVVSRLITTSIAEILRIYGNPVLLVIAYIVAVVFVQWCVERVGKGELNVELNGWGSVLVVFTTPIVAILGFFLVWPLLPASVEAVTPLHMLQVLLAATALMSLFLWPLLSFDARRLLPPHRVGRLGIELIVVSLGVVGAMDFVLTVA